MDEMQRNFSEHTNKQTMTTKVNKRRRMKEKKNTTLNKTIIAFIYYEKQFHGVEHIVKLF